VEEDKDGKLICEKITSFDQVPRKIWIRFPDKEAYAEGERQLLDAISYSEGHDRVGIFIDNPKSAKELPPNQNVHIDDALVDKLSQIYGQERVKVTFL
jgi:DNA polymerase-3 subunit alpha